jgi:hypothetical protein
MKKILFSLVLLAGSYFSAHAQTEQGNMLVGGNVLLNTTKNNTRIGITPSAGYFVARNLAVGAALGLDYTKTNIDKTTTFGVGPFARYYFGSLNFRPFLDAELSFQSVKDQKGSSSNTYNSTNYFLGGGLAAFINRNVAIEGLAGYSHSSYSSLGNSGGFNLRIGFQVYINRAEVANMTNSNL